ncbi:MAG: amidophosphoribosyltransferase [Bacteroidota bacterium]|nr:amidophosphoribosyltransferase [Bacteroidota bacterium]
MSDQIKHECGIALIRLLKPLEYYLGKYGELTYGINKLYLLMEKQHNRGQDGAGVACVKFDLDPGRAYLNRLRSNSSSPIRDIFDQINGTLYKVYSENSKLIGDPIWLKNNVPFVGELYLGHLRYGTFGGNSIENCHPFLRENNWKTRNLAIAGNFNLTNVDELFQRLLGLGQNPIDTSDNITILEKIGHFLDMENERLFRQFKEKGYTRKDISPLIAKEMDIQRILSNACRRWDGGYVIGGLLGHGDAFVLRDEAGIRPAFYYHDDEVVVVASERPVIQTAFNVPLNTIHEIKPGHALIIKKEGKVGEYKCKDALEKKSCSFERIYFSRGTDADIYQERKNLGKFICPEILKSINYDIENTVFSYIPNTASAAFYGLTEAVTSYCNDVKKERILKEGPKLNEKKLEEILKFGVRIDKVAVKDIKLRTFITQDVKRDDMAAHVYDVTYGTVRKDKDTLVVIDDSIVRGTTLKQSILRMLDRLSPKKIIVVSSAPQIRYPDCYGIDMAKLSDFIAFKAVIELLRENNKSYIINEVYRESKAQENLPKEEIVNYVKKIYKPFTPTQISNKISSLLTPKGIKAEVEIIFQTIENLHAACPDNNGDWYFTGDYPTPGGNKVVNRSFINYIEGRNERAY